MQDIQIKICSEYSQYSSIIRWGILVSEYIFLLDGKEGQKDHET